MIDYKNRIETAHPNLTVIGKPSGNLIKVRLHCGLCGMKWSATPGNLATSDNKPKHGCPRCWRNEMSRLYRVPSKEIISRLQRAHPSIVFADKVATSTRYKINFRCLVCSHVWTQSPAHIMTANGVPKTGCPSCKESKGEKAVTATLKKLKIVFEIQKRFASCRNKKPLPFDFYLPDYEVLIEFQGYHHFHPTRRRDAIKEFKLVKRRDAIKRSWAKSNGFKLVEIKYGDNVESILKTCLNRRG